MPTSADTLFLPFEAGKIDRTDGDWLYMNAIAPQRGFSNNMQQILRCIQPLRGQYLDLEMRGINVSPQVNDMNNYAGACILIGKHRGENEAMLIQAALHCRHNASILVAGDKTSGIASFKKRLSSIIEIDGSMAKYHANVFWFQNTSAIKELKRQDFTSPDGFKTAPGMFSAEKIDKGSALLAEFFDNRFSGDIADFGAGWGYLSKVLLEKSRVKSLHVYETHWPSLEAAKWNLAAETECQIQYNWIDLTKEKIIKRFDYIIMNPPFHTGRRAEPALGERFIEIAAGALKPKGQLLLVANSGLSYEKKLARCFKKHECLIKRDGFKVLKAYHS